MPLTDQQILDFMQQGLARGLDAAKIREVLQKEGARIPNEQMRFDTGERTPSQDTASRYDLTGTQTRPAGKYKEHVPGMVEQTAGFVAKNALQVAPYLIGGEGGAAIGARVLARAPYLGRLLGSAIAQGGVSAAEDIAGGKTPDVLKAGATAATSFGTEGLLGEFGKLAAQLSGVPRETASDVMRMSPGGRARMVYGAPPKGAELAQADIATESAKQALSPTNKTIGRRTAERKMAEFDLAGTVPTEAGAQTEHPLSANQFHKQYSSPARAEHVVGTEFGGLPAHMSGAQWEAAYPNSKVLRKKAIESAIDSGQAVPRQILEDFPDLLYKQEARVDMTPIKQRLGKMIKSETWRSDEQKSANALLRDKITNLPDEMKLRDFDQWITEHTQPVGKKIGTIDQGLPTQARKEIVRFAREYRNKVIPSAKTDFLQASKDLGVFKRFRKQIMEAQGDPKVSVENVWRRLPQNQELLRTFRRFDEAATRNGIPSALTEDALYLSKKRDWTSDDVFHAYLILRGTQRFLIRPVAAKIPLVTAPFVGRIAGSATNAFMSAMEPKNNP